MLAQLMGASGDPAMSVRVAKNASYSGLNLLSYLHPVSRRRKCRAMRRSPHWCSALPARKSESIRRR